MIDMYKKRKIEIIIESIKPINIGELHAPNLLSAYIVKKEGCRESTQLNKSINYSLKF
jgi:hypothetical protein